MTVFRDMKVVLSRAYRVGEHAENLDPHYTTVTIGGFCFANHDASMRIKKPADYRTLMRNIEIFSMSVGAWVQIDFARVFRYLGLYNDFESNDPTISWMGHESSASTRRGVDWLRPQVQDRRSLIGSTR